MATFYSPKEYKEWQAEAAAALKAVKAPEVPFEGPVVVGIDIRVTQPKTTKLPHPKPDVDNYAKAVLDALTVDGRFWRDDSQVQTLIVDKAWADSSYIQVAIGSA